MSTMQSEVFEAFRAIDVPEDKALKAAEALSRRDVDVTTLKADVSMVKADVGALRADTGALRVDVNALKVDVSVLKWMVGFMIALQVAIGAKLFIH